MRLAMLGNPNGWYARDLRRAARVVSGISIDVLAFEHLLVQTSRQGELSVHCRDALDAELLRPIIDRDGQPMYDALVIRTMPLGTLEQVIFRMNALHAIATQGIRVINPPRALEIAIDKWLTLDLLRQQGMTIPLTYVCQDRRSALEAFEYFGGDVVVKPLFGGEGRGIVRVNCPEMAWRVFSTLEQLRAVIYLQEFIPHHGFDLRLLVMGEEVFAVARHALNGDWRTNVSRGGEAVPFEATEHQRAMARQAAAAIGGVFVGVDILPACDGRDVLLEVNAVPGWKGTGHALSIDIGLEFLKWLGQSCSATS